MIAYCGLTCTECPAYLATQANDLDKIKEIATAWAAEYKADVGPDDVWCDGCLADGRKCSHCAECEIRACGQDRSVDHCAACDDYACEQLAGFFEVVPQAKANLDGLR